MAFTPLRPLPIKDRRSMLFIGRSQIDVKDGAFVAINEENGERMVTPIGTFTCLMLEPGTRISHAAVKLAAEVGTLLVWVGEGGVRFYAAGQPGGARADKLQYQARLAGNDELRLKVVRKMFAIRFGEEAPQRRSVDQLRGIEGSRVRACYQQLAQKYGVEWHGRQYDPKNWDGSDIINQCISAATACLYGITEAAILAAGYAPALGFLHVGRPQSFVYDIADIIKFDSVVPLAFKIAATSPSEPDRAVRIGCRKLFTEHKTLDKLIPLIEDVLAAGEIQPPEPWPDSQPPPFPAPEQFGEEGHR